MSNLEAGLLMEEVSMAGRKSELDLERAGPILPGTRPEPPTAEGLTPEQAEIWYGITSSMPASWFTYDVLPLLTQMVRHIDYARYAAAEISLVRAELQRVEKGSDAESEAWATLHQLLRAHCLQSERISQLGTKLRMTNQARLQTRQAGQQRRVAGSDPVKPWNDWGRA